MSNHFFMNPKVVRDEKGLYINIADISAVYVYLFDDVAGFTHTLASTASIKNVGVTLNNYGMSESGVYVKTIYHTIHFIDYNDAYNQSIVQPRSANNYGGNMFDTRNAFLNTWSECKKSV